MRKLLTLLFSGALLTTSLVPLSSTPASAATTLITCTDLTSQKMVALKESQKSCKPLLATAIWHIQQSDSSAHTGAGYANLRTCTSKRAGFNYQLIKSKCAKYQVSNDYWRSAALPAKPVITKVSSYGHESAILTLASESEINTDAPIAYYTITSSKGDVMKVYFWRDLNVIVRGLSSSTSYTFTITATSVDGTSPVSASSLPVTTQTYVAPVAAATTEPLAAPAFTLSTSAETKTLNTTISGYTISSTGGTIASYAISPSAPAGTTFSTSTGLLTGIPASTQGATAYTITATNATGSATRTFTLTVTAILYSVGDTGPGGGKIFYVATTPFACGPTRSGTCTYLEAAPARWNAGAAEPRRIWAQSTPMNYQGLAVINAASPETATATAIGWGYRNTRAIILQGNSSAATSAAALADSYSVTVSGVTYDDWYLPSKDELNQMCKWVRGVAWTSDATVCAGGSINSGGATGFVEFFYWSSTEFDADRAWFHLFLNGLQNYEDKYFDAYVRPVRAF
jgi:hypothetical protein